jgi:antitoxin component YwqK of YwqJK toxin-antitoxin module
MDNKLIINSEQTDRDDEGYIYYQGKLFSGKLIWHTEDGKIGSEVDYQNGLQNGCTLGWYKNGKKRNEKFYKNGRIHGYVREWYESGQIKREEEIYDGVAISEKHWDENGNLIHCIDRAKK